MFGGQSPEHEISVISAKNIYNAVDKSIFNLILCGVSKTGCFYRFSAEELNSSDSVEDHHDKNKIINFFRKPNSTTTIMTNGRSVQIDTVFCIIHGQNGEDGAIQGFCKIYNLSIVGCDLTSSVICIDKTLTKIIAERIGVKVTEFFYFYKDCVPEFNSCVEKIQLPFFMKVANLGSSIGVYKIKSENDYNSALKIIWQLGDKVLVEKNIDEMKEVEVAIVEINQEILVSEVLGEVKHNKSTYEFYDYTAKYLDNRGAKLIIPADISEKLASQIKQIAKQIFKACGCQGISRVDFFLKGEEIYFNEINTLPGFTKNSMYPILFEKSGLSYKDLITNLINSSMKNVNPVNQNLQNVLA